MSGKISRIIEGDILSWIFVLSAIVLEIVGTTCTKLSEGLTKVGFSALMLACYCGTCILIALAVKRLEIGIVYAVWCGLGITIIALIGIFIFHEPSNPLKLIGIGLILAGTLILELLPFTPESTPADEIPQQYTVSSPADTASSQVPVQSSQESGDQEVEMAEPEAMQLGNLEDGEMADHNDAEVTAQIPEVSPELELIAPDPALVKS